MEGMLSIGSTITSESRQTYRVVKLLGAGGQGEVYDVDLNGSHYALKWYYKHMATDEQKAILDNLITKGTPDSSFLWPQDLIDKDPTGSFGYIMPLRPKNYKSIVDLMKRRAEPSFYSLCRAAYNLTKGYEKLHTMGFSYRDISFGNLFFNPDNGDVLICDNDNVSANGNNDSTVYGTPRFMAPEIVTGKAKPSRNTDLFSLAVLLFYMLMMHHPLEGKLEANIKCMDVHAMTKLYGTNPVFIFDPIDQSNRPVPKYQENAIIYWPIYPESIRSLFTQSFTIGLSAPNKRVTEKQWLDAFANLMTGIIICPKCGVEVFFDEQKAVENITHKCWNCHKTIFLPSSIIIEKNRVLLSKGAKLLSHHINNDYDMDTVVGEVVQHPSNPNQLGIKNKSKGNWIFIKPDGQHILVAPEKSVSITNNCKLNFGTMIGIFQ